MVITNRPLRVAFVDYVLEPDKPGRSGLSDVVWDMASELTNQGHEAHVIASYHTQEYPDDRVIVHNFPTPPIGYRNIIGQLWTLKRAADIAKRLRPDIIHAPEYVSTALFAKLGVSAPLVLTVPGNIFQRLREGHDYEWHFVQVLKWAARTSAQECAKIIAISQEMKRWWEWTGSQPERTPYIPYGIDPRRFHPVVDAKTRLGIKSPLFFLYVGRFSTEKGLLDLVNALALIKPLLESAQVQVSLVGKGPQEQEIRECVREKGLGQIVKIHPWVAQDDLRIWYSAADTLLMPSWNEPLGKVMIESMFCSTPVIASATEGPKDHIHPDKNGFLFPAHDIQALANILRQVIQHPELLYDMKQHALSYVQENLTWERVTRKIVDEVYVPIINQHNKDSVVPYS